MTQEYMLPFDKLSDHICAPRLSRWLAPNVMDFQCRSLVFPRFFYKRSKQRPRDGDFVPD